MNENSTDVGVVVATAASSGGASSSTTAPSGEFDINASNVTSLSNNGSDEKNFNVIGQRVRSFYDDGSLDGVIVAIETAAAADETPNIDDNQLIVAVRFDNDPTNLYREECSDLQLLGAPPRELYEQLPMQLVPPPQQTSLSDQHGASRLFSKSFRFFTPANLSIFAFVRSRPTKQTTDTRFL
jgi:hypothetical protein